MHHLDTYYLFTDQQLHTSLFTDPNLENTYKIFPESIWPYSVERE